MDTGTVGYKNYRVVKHVKFIEQDTEIVKEILKTKYEKHPDL